MSAVIYKHRLRVMTQRVLSFANYGTIEAALCDPSFVFSMDETAIAISNRGKVVEGNLVAGFIWELLDGTRSADSVAELVIRQFNVDYTTARRDIDLLLDRLKSYDLVEETAEPPCSSETERQNILSNTR
jgi:methyltransferase-like protein